MIILFSKHHQQVDCSRLLDPRRQLYVLNHIMGNPKLSHFITLIETQLKDSWYNSINKTFWSDIAPRLIKLHYTKPFAEQELLVAGMSSGADMIDPNTFKHKHDGPTVELGSRKQQKARETREIKQVVHDRGAIVSLLAQLSKERICICARKAITLQELWLPEKESSYR